MRSLAVFFLSLLGCQHTDSSAKKPILLCGQFAGYVRENQQVFDILDSSKWLVVAAIFVFCVAPTFISYQVYLFGWDDATYLRQSIAVSRAFWSGNVHGLGAAMVSYRPPAMTLLGLPWGPLASWDAAGKCFITLAAVISLLAASCLYLLIRIGVKPIFLVVASACVFASLGPYPHLSTPTIPGLGPAPWLATSIAHLTATAFLADSLLAWTSLAALLLIPYEARTHCPSVRGAVVRGILWSSILSLGAMTKVSFFYFIVLIVPTLFLIRLYRGGLRSALAALIAFAWWSAPSAFYLVRWGGSAFKFAKASSFGGVAGFYYVPLWQFFGNTIRESPGMALSFVLTVTALSYLVIKRQTVLGGTDYLAPLILIGFGIVVLASPNREIRFLFPVIVGLPFLTGVLMSGEGHPALVRSATLAAGLVFFGLLAAGVPMRHRASTLTLSRSDAVLALAARCNAKRIVLATNSATLSFPLLELAIEVLWSGDSVKVDQVRSVANNLMFGVPIEEDFREMSEADQVVFQGGIEATDQRISEHEEYIRQHGYVPIRVGDDLRVYLNRASGTNCSIP